MYHLNFKNLFSKHLLTPKIYQNKDYGRGHGLLIKQVSKTITIECDIWIKLIDITSKIKEGFNFYQDVQKDFTTKLAFLQNINWKEALWIGGKLNEEKACGTGSMTSMVSKGTMHLMGHAQIRGMASDIGKANRGRKNFTFLFSGCNKYFYTRT